MFLPLWVKISSEVCHIITSPQLMPERSRANDDLYHPSWCCLILCDLWSCLTVAQYFVLQHCCCVFKVQLKQHANAKVQLICKTTNILPKFEAVPQRDGTNPILELQPIWSKSWFPVVEILVSKINLIHWFLHPQMTGLHEDFVFVLTANSRKCVSFVHTLGIFVLLEVFHGHRWPAIVGGCATFKKKKALSDFTQTEMHISDRWSKKNCWCFVRPLTCWAHNYDEKPWKSAFSIICDL